MEPVQIHGIFVLQLELALWDRLSNSKNHKAYYLFAVLFSEAYWLKDNVRMVRKAVRNNTLHHIKDKRHPDEQDDDNIDIYFLEEGNGKFFIVLLYNPLSIGTRQKRRFGYYSCKKQGLSNDTNLSGQAMKSYAKKI